MPATKTFLLLSSLPASLVAVGDMPGGDPRPMLFWYVALAVPTLVSVAVGILTIFEFFNRRGESAKAASLGGYVTHVQMNGELEKVYQAVKNGVRDGLAEMKEDITRIEREQTKLGNTSQAHGNDISRLDERTSKLAAARRH